MSFTSNVASFRGIFRFTPIIAQMLSVSRVINPICRKMSGATSAAAKILFTDTGSIGDGSVALTMGAPAERHLTKVSSIMEKASQHAKVQPCNADASYLQYGPRQGSPRYRKEVAKFLSQGYGDEVDSESLVVTAGATHGLHLVGSVILPPKATVYVEDPTYFIAINLLRDDLGLNVVPVPTDAGGMDTQVLENLLIEQKASSKQELTDRKPFSSLIYVVPTYNNPRGYHIPPDRCTKLVQLARKYDALIFCDDVYNLLHFEPETRAPPRLLTYDKKSDADYKGGNALSNGTFSKIMAPGLRVGWIESGPRITNLLKTNMVMLSAGSANQYTSEVVASALELNLEQDYLKGLNAEYLSSVNALCSTLKETLPEGCTFNWPKGGYFIWIEMPEHGVASEVAKLVTQEHKIKVLPGQMCSATGNYKHCIRISFSSYPEDVLVESAKKLSSAIAKHLQSIQQ